MGAVGNELKKKKPVVCHVSCYDVSQWFAMFHAMMYPRGKGTLLFTVSQLPKMWPKLPSVPQQQIWLECGVVAWTVSPLTPIHSFNPSDFKGLSLFYTGLPTTSGHSICTFQAGSKGASWPGTPWPECVCVCMICRQSRTLWASLKMQGQEHSGTSEEPQQ